MYAAVPDPYCYLDSTVLKNRRNLRKQRDLDRFETVMTAWRSKQAMPAGRLSVTHYKALHRHLFQDVYS
jgi:cell filamentation protein